MLMDEHLPDQHDAESGGSLAAEDQIVELGMQSNQQLDQLTYIADVKAQVVLGADALLAVTILPAALQGIPLILSGTASAAQRVGGLAYALWFATVIGSMYYSLLAARPTLKVGPKQRRSLFYFGYIALLTEKEFLRDFLSQSRSEIGQAVAAQVYAKSVVVNRKFGRLQRSIDLLVASLVMWVVAQVLFALPT
jgi:hypothetical protein